MEFKRFTDSRLKDLQRFLTGKGHDVYFLGQHPGECLKEYLIVRDAGVLQYGATSSNQALYEVLIYVPEDRLPDMEPLVSKIKKEMKGIYPMFIPTHSETASHYDDEMRAWMYSIQYRVSKRQIIS